MQSKFFLLALLSAVILAPHAGAQNITFDQADRLNPFFPFNVTKADLNKDGYPDLMFSLPSSRNIYTLMSNKSGNYVDWTIPTSYCPSTPIGVGDFQRDGSQNILVGYPSLLTGPCGGTTSQGATFAEYSNNGSAIFNKYTTPQGESVAAAVADFNGDGKLDIAAYNGNIGLYYGSGYGHFSPMYKIAAIATNVYQPAAEPALVA